MHFKSLFKKMTAIVSVAAICFSASAVPVLAASSSGYTTYKFSALDVIVQVPDNYVGFTRTVSNNNSYLKNLGADDAAEVRASMTATNTYLEAIPKDESTVSFELVLSGKDADTGKVNLENLSDEDLYKEFQTYIEKVNSSKNSAETVTGIEIYKGGDTIFFKSNIESVSNNVKVYATKYYTVMQGKEVTINGQASTNPLTDNQSTILKNMVDTAEFTSVAWTPFESVIFMEILHYFLSLGVPILVLALIVFLLIRINKKRSSYYRR